MAGAPPSKRLRMQTDTISGEGGSMTYVNYLARLPIEMLAEILSYTSSPDILSLARTSRFFCATLVSNPSSLFIWKDARKRFRPRPIPDPAPNWTECAYIAFIFDSVPCEICGRLTQRTPYSYALRARLCDSGKCRETWVAGLTLIRQNVSTPQVDLAHAAAVQSWLLCHEDILTHNGRLYRTADWEAAIQQHRASVRDPVLYALIQQDYAKKALFRPHVMRYAERLHKWGAKVEEWRIHVHDHNISFLQEKANAEKWEIRDFINTPLYTNLRKLKENLAEKITEQDFMPLKDEFKEQVAHCRIIRIRRAVEDVARVNREEIRSYWNRLKTAATCPLPSYPEFRRLNMVKTLISKNTDECSILKEETESVREELKTNVATQEHIAQQISAWRLDKETKLAKKLGFEHLALDVVAGFIHPVRRVTARFMCTQCKRVGKKIEGNKSLTFEDVCAHQCLGRSKKERLKGAWNVDWFEPDQKAVAAAKDLLRVCNLDEQLAAPEHLSSFGCRFLCKTCTDPIVMDSASVIGHSQRHETMALELLNQEQADTLLRTPLQHGLVAKLMGFSKSGKKQRSQQMFGCRHCQTSKIFTFDGLRSHVKAKHNITEIRDEDFMQKELNVEHL